jgi:tetratricopeptide (TPR) repeat protein
LLLGRLDEAYDYIERSLRLEGENPRLLTSAGNVLFHQGKYEVAAKTYEHAFAADPGYAPALYNLHMAMMVSGEAELAGKVSESLRKSIRGWQSMTASALEAAKRKDYRRAIEDVEMALTTENLAALTNFKGILQLEYGNVDGAEETFGRLCESSFDPSEAHNNLGMTLLKKGDWDGASSEFDRAIRARKGNSTAWNNRGCILYKEERLREAIACFEESLVINPTAIAMNNKGFSQLSMDVLEDALVSFDQSVKIRETPEAYNNKGIALRRLGRVDEAITAFRESLRLSPQFEDTSANLREAIAEQASMVPEPKDEEVPPPPPPAADPKEERRAIVRHQSESSLKAKRKAELEALCISLDISSKGTKRELVSRILKEKKRLLKR